MAAAANADKQCQEIFVSNEPHVMCCVGQANNPEGTTMIAQPSCRNATRGTILAVGLFAVLFMAGTAPAQFAVSINSGNVYGLATAGGAPYTPPHSLNLPSFLIDGYLNDTACSFVVRFYEYDPNSPINSNYLGSAGIAAMSSSIFDPQVPVAVATSGYLLAITIDPEPPCTGGETLVIY